MDSIVFAACSTGDRQAVKRLKSTLTLDFNDFGVGGKRSRPDADGILSTPDVGLLKLGSPELERLVLQQYQQQQQQQQQQQFANKLTVDQQQQQQHRPATVSTTLGSLDRRFVPIHDVTTTTRRAASEDPDSYARGFVEALLGLHNRRPTTKSGCDVITSADNNNDTVAGVGPWTMNNSRGTCLTTSGPPSSIMQTNVNNSFGFAATDSYSTDISETSIIPGYGSTSGSGITASTKSLKRPCTTSSCFSTTSGSGCVAVRPDVALSAAAAAADTPPISPIDMVDQERIKLERKRARNRVAATRCRNRKLERIDQLQEQADALRATNARLAAEVTRLRETVCQLRRDVVRHAECQPGLMFSGLDSSSSVLQQQQQQQQQFYESQ